jgi:iron-sulfur cluster assembly protein
MMLALTDDAVMAITTVVSDHSGAGLRIVAREADGQRVRLGLALADEPEPTDQVLEEQGTLVFLAEDVAPLLDERTLDGSIAEGEPPTFWIVPEADE